jgi:hypothetical protein
MHFKIKGEYAPKRQSDTVANIRIKMFSEVHDVVEIVHSLWLLSINLHFTKPCDCMFFCNFKHGTNEYLLI